MFNRATRNLLFLGTILSSSALLHPVLAQQNSGNEQGLFYSLSAEVSHVNNILRLSEEEKDENPNLQASDSYLDADLTLGYGKRIGRQILSLNVNAGQRFHKNNTQLDNENLGVSSTLNWKLGASCSGQLSGNYQRRQAQIETIDDIIANDVKDRTGSIFTACRVGGRLSVTGGFSLSELDNEQERSQLNDRNDTQYSAGLRYSIGQDKYIGLFGSRTDTKYENRTFTNDLKAELTSESISGEVSSNFGPNLIVTGNIGYQQVKDNSPEANETKGLSYSIGVEYTLAARHKVNLNLSKNTVPQENLRSIFSTEQTTEIGINSSWSPKLSSQVSFRYRDRKNEYGNEVNPIFGPRNLSDETYGLQGRINYSLGRLIELSVGARYDRRNADNDLFSYDDKGLFLRVSIRN
ncbi:outer membrane beta-barrel protein [Kordiimonas sediminis]|uniref:outer membrane beta-barrel protein n=1 Tax=Kordiimonas sediminis TaxID=1735581 RepID=UPI00174CBC6B|nr:outer membrane beta-barrel protein [Kordiimonas sediminis]